MGNTPVEATWTTDPSEKNKRRRRLHPVRRIAKLILGNPRTSRKPTQDQIRDHEQAKICHGPSQWHYLLPFIGPLISIDPKLSFIEDRILRRKPRRKPEPNEAPRSLDELRREVQEADVPCDCDECAPKLYKISSTKSHGIIQDQRNSNSSTRYSIDSSYQKQPKNISFGPRLNRRFRGDYEAMTLVRHHMAWLDATYLHPSARTTPTVQQLRSLLQAWHPHITGLDMRRTLSIAQLSMLFTHLNRVFFSDCVPAHNALLTTGFSYLAEQQRDCFGTSLFNPLIGTQILIHPTLYRGNGTPSHHHHHHLDMVRLHNRLGTMMHEMCHAFLTAYSCRSCCMHEACDGATGHGRAWQLLAKKLEQVACVVLGGTVDMGREPSLLREVHISGRLPSCHDLEAYGMNSG